MTLVQSLRTHQYCGFNETNAIMDAAADEIERLTKALRDIADYSSEESYEEDAIGRRDLALAALHHTEGSS